MLSTPQNLLVASFNVYRSHLWIFVGYTAWLLIPMMLFIVAGKIPGQTASFLFAILMTAVQMILSLWITISVMRCGMQLKNNQPLDSNTLSLEALRDIRPLLMVVILQLLIVAGGTLLLIVPGIIFWIRYSFAQQAVIIDKQTPKQALSFSRSLVKGRSWSVLVRLLFGPIVIGLVYALVLGGIVFVLGSLLGIDTKTLFSDDPILWVQIIESIGDIFMIPLFILYSLFLYEELKTSLPAKKLEKEGAVA